MEEARGEVEEDPLKETKAHNSTVMSNQKDKCNTSLPSVEVVD